MICEGVREGGREGERNGEKRRGSQQTVQLSYYLATTSRIVYGSKWGITCIYYILLCDDLNNIVCSPVLMMVVNFLPAISLSVLIQMGM